MNLASLFVASVFAAEGVISPIPDPLPTQAVTTTKPEVSFAQLSVPQVLGLATEVPTPTPSNSVPIANTTHKSSYTIAVLGDSMVDTLGPGVPHLARALKIAFPHAEFTLYNYGVGGTNIDYGLERVTSDYQYLGTPVPSLVSRHPDIVVVESFGYNPYSFDEGAINKHWLKLAEIVDTVKRRLPGVTIIIAATVSPDRATFGDGALGLAFSAEDKRKKTDIIKEYLESTVRFAQSQHLPLADAYHASVNSPGRYINGGDHIHPSDMGKELFAQKIIDAMGTLSI